MIESYRKIPCSWQSSSELQNVIELWNLASMNSHAASFSSKYIWELIGMFEE